MTPKLRIPPFLALVAILLAFPPAAAQYGDEEDGYGIDQSVARVSHFEGDVSFRRGDDPGDWQSASINYPMTLGDRIWAGRGGRVELQLRGGRVYLGPGSELAALNLTRDVCQLSLTIGTASFRLDRLERDEVFEVATPNVSVTFETSGIYRVDVGEDGRSRVSVYRGRAYAAAAGGQVSLDRGDQIRIWGIDNPSYDVVGLPRADAWDSWVERRARRHLRVRSDSYVHPEIYGTADLDAYGSWANAPGYGPVWYPRGVAAGWEPYRSGRWIWRDPWGWTWLSSEAWGWAPYHYGRWAVVRNRWCWVPVGPRSRYPGYSPAIVGFVGGGAGWSVSISGGGFVGWFPLGPREPFDPWWRHSRSTTNVAGFNYAYRSRAIVVARSVFVGGGRVDRDYVRDRRVVREVSTAPVLRGPIPVLPTRESIRAGPVDARGRDVVRPPERIGRREVVTRTAPPPAPPSFDRKLVVIREKGGEPVPIDVARRISADEPRGEKGAQPVRPAAREGVLLSPRGEVKAASRPQPLPPSANRPPAPAPTRPAPEARPEPRAPAPAPTRPVPEARPEPRAPAPAPTRPVPEARPEPRPPARPSGRTLDRPAPVPTPNPERPPAPEPRVERPAPKPERPRLDRVDPRTARPDQVQPRAVKPDQVDPRAAKLDPVDPRTAKPGQAESRATKPDKTGPKPTPDKSKERGDHRAELEKKND